MAVLTLQITKPSLTLGVGNTMHEGLRLHFHARSDDELVRGLYGAVELQSVGDAIDCGAIGVLRFNQASAGSSDGFFEPTPAGYSARIALPEDQLRWLVDMRGRGAGPTSVNLILGAPLRPVAEGDEADEHVSVIGINFHFETA